MTSISGFSAGSKWVIDYMAAAQQNVHGGLKSEYRAWIRRSSQSRISKPVLTSYVATLTPAGCLTPTFGWFL